MSYNPSNNLIKFKKKKTQPTPKFKKYKCYKSSRDKKSNCAIEAALRIFGVALVQNWGAHNCTYRNLHTQFDSDRKEAQEIGVFTLINWIIDSNSVNYEGIYFLQLKDNVSQ